MGGEKGDRHLRGKKHAAAEPVPFFEAPFAFPAFAFRRTPFFTPSLLFAKA